MEPKLSSAIVMHEKLPWNNRMLDLVVPVGPAIPKRTLKWLTGYAKSHNSPFVFAKHKTKNGKYNGDTDIKVFAPEPLRSRLLAWLDAGNKFW